MRLFAAGHRVLLVLIGPSEPLRMLHTLPAVFSPEGDNSKHGTSLEVEEAYRVEADYWPISKETRFVLGKPQRVCQITHHFTPNKPSQSLSQTSSIALKVSPTLKQLLRKRYETGS